MAHAPILFSLAIEKDTETNTLLLQVLFPHGAPNVTLTKTAVAWYPTAEELEFLNEAYSIIATSQPAPLEPEVEPEHHLNDGHDPSIRGTATEEEIHAAATKKTMAEQEQVFVQVDEKLIDEALRRRKNDGPGKVDEASLVDRITKKKKST